MSEKIPTPGKKREQREHVTLEGFRSISQEEAQHLTADVVIELDRVGVLDMYRINEEHESDVMVRKDPDGIDIVLGAVRNIKDEHISGVLVQSEGEQVVGRTTFTSDGNNEQSLVYVGNTNTWLHKKEGMGEQRLRLINEYTKEKFGKPLSSISRTESAQVLWDSLLERGLAERTSHGDKRVIYSLL